MQQLAATKKTREQNYNCFCLTRVRLVFDKNFAEKKAAIVLVFNKKHTK